MSVSRRALVLAAALLGTILFTSAQPASADLNQPARGTTIVATEDAPLRTGPSASDSLIATAPTGHTATVLSPTPTNAFYKVNYQGNVGWTRGTRWNAVAGLWVNGNRLTADEATSVRWIADNTIPRLEGARNTRLNRASEVAWWSLKEGVLEIDNVHAYSNCGGLIGPTAVCPSGRAWQVGIAAIQVPNFSLDTAEATALRLYPNRTLRGILGHTAVLAGFPDSTATHTAIVESTGTLRKSWLLRNHAVGVTLNAPLVRNECVVNSQSWCYGTGWDQSRRYAPNKSAAIRAIRELEAILYALAP